MRVVGGPITRATPRFGDFVTVQEINHVCGNLSGQVI